MLLVIGLPHFGADDADDKSVTAAAVMILNTPRTEGRRSADALTDAFMIDNFV
jgi:hypothetical protein